LIEIQKKSENLFYILESKMDSKTINMDFSDFLYENYKQYNSSNKFLIKQFDKLFKDWDIKIDNKKEPNRYLKN